MGSYPMCDWIFPTAMYIILGREEWAMKEWTIFIDDFIHLTLPRGEKVSWDEKGAGTNLSPELPLWDSLSLEMLDSE